jgi:flagellar hook-associated protein 3 FlgL
MRRRVSEASANVQTAQNQAASGLRVSKPSDDPLAAAAARRESSRHALADAGKSATDRANTFLQGSDGAINDVLTALGRARDLATASASSTVSAQDRSALAVEVRSIRDQMIALGNTNIGGRYVFGGHRDQAPPYASDGTFNGDSSTKRVEVLPGLQVNASIAGSAIFGDAGPGDMFQTLDTLASALEANDVDGVAGSLGALDANQARVSNARSQIGSMMSNVTVAGAVAERSSTSAQVEFNRLVAIDEVTAATNLVQAKTLLQSAIAIVQQMPIGGLTGGK